MSNKLKCLPPVQDTPKKSFFFKKAEPAPAPVKPLRTNEDFVRAKKALEKASIPARDMWPIFSGIVHDEVQTTSNHLIRSQVFAAEMKKDMLSTLYGANPNKEEETMTNTNTLTAAQQHLLNRLNAVENQYDKFWGSKYNELKKAFRLDGPPQPKHAEEMLEWVKTGRYTIDEKAVARAKADLADDRDHDDCSCFYGWDYGFAWGTKDEQPDHEGYDKALKAARAEAVKVKDAIYVKSADEALAALEAFESKTFH